MLSRRVPRPVLVGATVLVLLAVVIFVAARGDDSGPTPDQVRAVDLAALGDGEPARLGDILGDKPVVVNFFAEWCDPCRREMPDFERVRQELGDEVEIIGVAIDHSPRKSLELIATTGITYPTYSDPQGEVLALFEGTQMPTTVFIRPDGEVADTVKEELSYDELRTKIADELGVDS
jgi:thiol-disulfide isomerase/thioredoxin